MPTTGVLALQGDFAVHADALRRSGASVREVRRTAALAGLDGLVIPGGESTTLLNLMRDEPWFDRLREFHRDGGTIFGTCAGAILLSREVRGPDQSSLGLLDAVVQRNGYGRQRESFETTLDVPEIGGTVDAVFIRAPRFLSLGPGVAVLGRLQEEPVLVRENRLLAATFHPELTGDPRLHEYFVNMAAGGGVTARTGPNVAAAP